MCKRKSFFINTPSKTYGSYDEAYKEARALIAHIKYCCKKRNYSVYNIKIGVSNINPRLAEYKTVINGVGRPARELIPKSKKCPFVEAHLHILVIDSEHADTIAQIINDYLSKHHRSTKNSNYSLKPRKNPVPKIDIEKVIKYITVQSANIFSCKSDIPRLENQTNGQIKTDDVNESTAQNLNTAKVANKLSKEKNELLFNLRFSYLLAKFLFKISKLFDDLYAQELLNIKNQLCTAADYTKRNLLTHAYNILDITTASLTLLREKLRQLLHYSSIENKDSIELESENIYKVILEKLEKSEFSEQYAFSM